MTNASLPNCAILPLKGKHSSSDDLAFIQVNI